MVPGPMPNARNASEYVSRTLIAFLAGAALRLMVRCLLLNAQYTYNVNYYSDRIEEVHKSQFLMGTLLGAPMIGSGQVPVQDTNTFEPDEENHCPPSDPTFETRNREETLARSIFRNVAKLGTRVIDLEDLRKWFTEEEIKLFLSAVAVGRNGEITLQALSRWIVRANRFRAAVTRALSSRKKAAKQLLYFFDGFLIVVVSIIWLVLMRIIKGDIILVIFTQVAATAFIFGDSVKKVFDASVLLFVIQPFDVGDCCVINGIPVIIEDISILTTSVSNLDNEMIYYPISVLSTTPISNYSRSLDMGGSLEFSIDFKAQVEAIQQLEIDIQRYFKDNAHLWHPDHTLVMKEIDGMDKIKMVLNYKYSTNFRDFTVRNERKSMLIIELKRILQELQLKTEVKVN